MTQDRGAGSPGLLTYDEAEVRSLGVSQEDFAILVCEGIPVEILGRFRASAAPERVTTPEGPLVQFGQSMLDTPVCLDPVTGGVVELVGPDERLFVNGSLRLFVITAQQVVGRFPFYGPTADDDEVIAASGRVGQLVRRIEPRAMDPCQFWSILVDDIAQGNFDPKLHATIDADHARLIYEQ